MFQRLLQYYIHIIKGAAFISGREINSNTRVYTQDNRNPYIAFLYISFITWAPAYLTE